ncbi:MAG: hypothetical protein V3S68_07000 [Dehalococcoidia bacterium]
MMHGQQFFDKQNMIQPSDLLCPECSESITAYSGHMLNHLVTHIDTSGQRVISNYCKRHNERFDLTNIDRLAKGIIFHQKYHGLDCPITGPAQPHDAQRQGGTTSGRSGG